MGGGAKVKIESAGAETLSCYSGDTPHEEREMETRGGGEKWRKWIWRDRKERPEEADADSGVALRGRDGREDCL